MDIDITPKQLEGKIDNKLMLGKSKPCFGILKASVLEGVVLII